MKNERAPAGSDNVLRSGAAQPRADVPPLLPAVQRHEHGARAVRKPGHKRIVARKLKCGDNRLEPAIHLVWIAFPGVFVVERTLVDRERSGTQLLAAGKRIRFDICAQ